MKKEHLLGLAAIVGSFSFGSALGNEPFAIYHAFDMHVNDVMKKLSDLSQEGYTHIQLPPLQESGRDDDGNQHWYHRYQPVDFTKLEGRGNVQELSKLAQEAKKYGIKIIADVVFNHLKPIATRKEWQDAYWYCGEGDCRAKDALYAKIQFPTFSALDVNPWCDMHGDDWDDDRKRFECWGDGNWVDLDHSKVYVQNILKKHIDILFDAAKHMRPWALRLLNDHARWKKPYSWNYGEVLSTRASMHQPYQEIIPSTDFVLTENLVRALSFGGDLRHLNVVPTIGKKDVTFARNHDTIFNKGFENLKFGDQKDMELGWAFVLARKDGIPLVFKDDAKWGVVKAGLQFRKKVQDQKETVLGKVCDNCGSSTFLMMERGSEGFMMMNKANHPFSSGKTDLTLTNLEGCYKELQNNFHVSIEWNGNKKQITRWGSSSKWEMKVGPRTALFFVRDSWEKCRYL